MKGEIRRVGITDGLGALNSLLEIRRAISDAVDHASKPVMEQVFEEDVLLYLRKSLYDIGVGIDVQINSIRIHSYESNDRETYQGKEDT